jgi:hypothetical protein
MRGIASFVTYQLILQGICRHFRKPEQAFPSLALYNNSNYYIFYIVVGEPLHWAPEGGFPGLRAK